ncbi:GNAT family N-acetyltransferase [Aquibacillus halophilus]|uniref:GNAT family N-acetyltransferase n=1 Tax=Aquibacillus halophilus TaxID=930132 RepID=A0A6A8D803_9BACI|nr:GNAT family N-acetyltransferase [Aquibacillus halophilus]MRH41400.1 GNAT family N-acetyltransferase [Aquibacillus halophilus]
MTNVRGILELDCALLETFSKRIITPWGSFFYNESQPTSYDANHALISEPISNPTQVIIEVMNFYQSKNIIPRFYIYNLQKQQELIYELKAKGFGYEVLNGPIQLWSNQNNKTVNDSRTTIEVVNKENYQEAFEIECSIKEFGGKEALDKVYEEQFNHPAFTHYLLRFHGVACSTACVFIKGSQARLESIATLEAYRGRGLVGELIHFIQEEVRNKEIEKLWVLPINETIEKVYQKYGFKTVERIKMGHAFLGGKSIKEIQGE